MTKSYRYGVRDEDQYVDPFGNAFGKTADQPGGVQADCGDVDRESKPEGQSCPGIRADEKVEGEAEVQKVQGEVQPGKGKDRCHQAACREQCDDSNEGACLSFCVFSAQSVENGTCAKKDEKSCGKRRCNNLDVRVECHGIPLRL